MKAYYNLIGLLLIGFIIVCSCQPKIDIAQEEEAIMAVVQAEGDAAEAMDIELLSDVFVKDELNVRLGIGGQSYRISQGWSEIESIYKSYWENPIEGIVWENSKENQIIRITGNAAWVICDNIWEWELDGETGQWSNIEVVFLEKINDVWKVNFMTFLPSPGKQSDKDKLDKARDEILKRFGENDIDGFFKMYTADHKTIPPGEKTPENLDDLRLWQEKRIAMAENYETKFEMELFETEMYYGIAYDRFNLNLKMKSKINGQETISKNQCIWIWKKDGGQWKLARAIWNEI